MSLNYTLLDVFTTTRFQGNPLAIVRVPANQQPPLTQELKQKIAIEFNLSETIFLHEPAETDGSNLPIDTLAIDTFTPECELPFAGHPTIGTATYIFQNYPAAIAENLKALQTNRAGTIAVSRDPQTGLVRAALPIDFHLHQAQISSTTTPKAPGPFPVVSIAKGLSFVLAELPDTDALGAVQASVLEACVNPRMLDEGWNEGLIGTKYFVDLGRDEAGCRQLRTRMFISFEDPGTGSASTALACLLALREPRELGAGPFEFHVVQGVEMGRRNDIFVRVRRSEDGSEVVEALLQGRAIVVGEGRIML
ncbi:PhzF family phenazine biosynthesis protein [Aspergillus saccharolyticus JOP 1030-1]|uniref:Diaminopimelate epimerase-like protein n=1 Tax=Aspergillus saccharolyticus JOP 1030-1 TaxID=1450539 RepID=A0A319AGX2_9EURO|nr:Diaminopimelate epimerase-like protein [Aspergillus saccharolyticus JOP 1030-1]PYH45882.1 Diaminopimelate epimerase-like protein [Aspergillus saccharolyticus JOP 1030-1]